MDEPEQMDLTSEVRNALADIAAQDPDGLIQPETVVEVAKDPGSPLHRYFEWNVDLAAQQHWLARARQIVAHYTTSKVENSVAYVNVIVRKGQAGQRRGYMEVGRACADPDLYDQIVTEARKTIISLRNKLSAFERARSLVAALDAATKQMTVNRSSKRKAA